VAPKATPPEQRIWDYIDVRDVASCWNWKRYRDKDGYGSIKHNGKLLRAHRFVLSLKLKRHVLPRMMALHICDNPACCNPEHLYEGTATQNMRDKIARGRGADLSGENNNSAKLTSQEVASIRFLHKTGTSYSELMSIYGVSRAAISMIINNKTWRHI